MRVIEHVPEPHYDLSIRQRLISNHALHRSQRKCEKRVAAALQCRSYRGRMDELTYSRNRRGVRKVGRLYAGGRFCDSKVCATLMASTIARSELMRKNAPGTLAYQLNILPTRFPVQMPALARTLADDYI